MYITKLHNLWLAYIFCVYVALGLCAPACSRSGLVGVENATKVEHPAKEIAIADESDSAHGELPKVSTATAAPVDTETETHPEPVASDSDSEAPADTEEIDAVKATLELSQPAGLETDPLARFFSTLRDIDRRSESHPVRIVHFGDSHTAADVMTSTIRRMLQERFGDGGRGFAYIGKPWPAYRLVDAVVDARGAWKTHRALLSKPANQSDGRYGLGGIAVESTEPGASVTLGTSTRTEFCDTASHFDIFYLKQPGGGTFSILVDGRRIGKVRTRSNRFKTGFKQIAVSKGPHRIDLRVRGNGKVRLFGVSMEVEGVGVSYDALGINGGFFYTPLWWDNVVFKDQIIHRDPDLIITMYGANEAGSRKMTRQDYTKKVTRALSKLTKNTPKADCLVIGPMDRLIRRNPKESAKRLDMVIDVQKRMAENFGCGFMDLRALMGGPGSIERWRRRKLARPDNVHLTNDGYRVLGTMVGERLLEAFERFLKERSGSSPSETAPPDEDTGARRQE
jgi:hypothetical protein